MKRICRQVLVITHTNTHTHTNIPKMSSLTSPASKKEAEGNAAAPAATGSVVCVSVVMIFDVFFILKELCVCVCVYIQRGG